MLVDSNKNKTKLTSSIAPGNMNQSNISFAKNNATPQYLLLSSDLSFTSKVQIQNTQQLNCQKPQTYKSQNTKIHISKNLSSPNIRSSWKPDPKDKLPHQSDQRFFQKESQRLKTTQTIESEIYRKDNTEKQQEFYKIKKSQPCDPSIRESKAQIKQIFSLKQSSRPEPLKFNLSTTNLNGNLLTISPKNLQNNKVFSESRLKLRDYLYMMNTSANLATEKKNSLNNFSNLSTGGNSKNKSFSRTNQTKPAKNQKYTIDNQKMYQVLKKQIKTDINNLKNKLICIEKYVNGLQSVESNQIKNLYQLRRDIQLYNSQIQDYCVNKIKIQCPTAGESFVNIIHQNEQEDFFLEI